MIKPATAKSMTGRHGMTDVGATGTGDARVGCDGWLGRGRNGEASRGAPEGRFVGSALSSTDGRRGTVPIDPAIVLGTVVRDRGAGRARSSA